MVPSSQNRLKKLIIVALFASLIGILAQITIPLPIIPITGQTLAIGLAATIIGSKYGTYATILYAVMGAIGMPVFTGMRSGLSVILGPSGGFILGFIPTVWIIGLIIERTSLKVIHALIANIIGMFVTLIIGTVWYKFLVNSSWEGALLVTFYPFLVGGFLKAYIAAHIGVLVRRRLIQAKLIWFKEKTA